MNNHWMFWKKKESDLTPEQEKIIRNALETYEMKELEYLKSQEELQGEHTFSPEFERKMDLLFQNHKAEFEKAEAKRTRSFIRIPKAAAAALCTVMVMVIFVGIKTEAIPFPKFNYILRKEEGCYAYLLEQEKYVKDTIEEKFELTYIPKGYKIAEITESKLVLTKNMMNDNGEICIFQQFAKDIIVRADEISKDYKEMIFSESRYYLTERNNFKRLIWYANGYQFVIQMDAPSNELVQIAQSIEVQ